MKDQKIVQNTLVKFRLQFLSELFGWGWRSLSQIILKAETVVSSYLQATLPLVTASVTLPRQTEGDGEY